MRRSIIRGSLVAAVIMGLVAGSARPADAAAYGWSHGLGSRTYFMPGGPRESYLTNCIVTTQLHKYPNGDVARVTAVSGVISGMTSSCLLSDDRSRISIVTFDGANLHFWDTGYTDDWIRANGPNDPPGFYNLGSGDAVGAIGHAIFGAEVSMVNQYGIHWIWDIGVF